MEFPVHVMWMTWAFVGTLHCHIRLKLLASLQPFYNKYKYDSYIYIYEKERTLNIHGRFMQISQNIHENFLQSI